MALSHGSPKPHVCFEVEKVIGVSSDGSYRVQWAPAWVSKFHLVGCEHLIQEFLHLQSEKEEEKCSEQTLESSELNLLPLEQNEMNTDSGDAFEQPNKVVIKDSDSSDVTLDMQKCLGASELSDIWPLVGEGSGHGCDMLGEDNNKGHLISTTTDHDNALSLATMVDKDKQESESKVSFNISNTDIQVKEEEEMMVVYPSDCINDKKTETFSPSKSNPSKTATRILPMSDPNRTYVVCPVSNHKKGPGTPSRGRKLPLEDIVRKISSSTMHDIGTMESPSFSQTVNAAQSHSDGTLTAMTQAVVGHKPHVCGYCGKSYTLKHHLTWHIRSHTGEKPYQCHVCEKAFSRNNILKEHLRTHYERPTYSCDVCSRPFKQKHALKKHQLTHTMSM